MRSTSSRHRAIALLLCGTLLWQSAPAVAGAEDGLSTEPALLLKYAAPDLPDRSAREVLDPIPAIVAQELRIRWLPVPTEPSGKAPSTGDIPVPDDAALRRIAGKVSRASERMERVESAAAERVSRGGREGVPIVPVHGGDAPLSRGDLSPAGDPPSLGGEGIRRRGALFPRSGVASGFHPGPRPVPPPGAVGMGSVRAPPRARSGTPGRVAPLRRADLRRRRASWNHPGPGSNEKYRAGSDPRFPPGIQGCRNDGSMASGGHGDIALLPSRRSGGSPRRTSCRRRAGKRRRRGPPGRGTLRGGRDPADRDPDARKGDARRRAARTALCRKTREP